MSHGFYADMGGFVLHGPGIADPFPIDNRQLLFLVKYGYLKYPQISSENIKDRNKSDRFARCIALFQAAWMVVNCIVRVAQGLVITTLELTTLSFILIFLMTSLCWYHKPQDITTRTPLYTETPIKVIRAQVC